jgi:hypothetical protein
MVPAVAWVRVLPDSAPEVVTATGTLLWLVELLPSWPVALLPQQ